MVDPTTSIAARLHLVSGKKPERVFDLAQERVNVGRDPSNIICLDSSTVSLYHAILVRVGAHYKLRDLVSTNGTHINGQRTMGTELHNGDILRFGEIEMRYEELPRSLAEPVPAPAGPLLALGRQRRVPKNWSKRAATLLLFVLAWAAAAWWLERWPFLHQAPPGVEQDIYSDPDYAAAGAAEDAKNFPEFLKHAKLLASRYPDDGLAQYILGVAYAKLNFFPDAAAAFRQAIKLRPDNIDAWNNLGWACAQSGRFAEAIAAFEQLVRLTPNDAQAWNSLGDAHADLGHPSDAIVAYQKAVELQPDFAEAHFKLGAALANQGKPAEAIDAFRLALKYKPDFPEAWFNLGVVSEQQKQNNEAALFFQQAIRLKPDYAEAWGGLVKAYLNLRQTDKAGEAAREMKRLDPVKAEQLADELSREAPPRVAAPELE
jgi:tetratricopeptide (TPR) repeat protein